MQSFSPRVYPSMPTSLSSCSNKSVPCTVQFLLRNEPSWGQSSGLEEGAWALTTQVKGILLPQHVNLSVQNYNQHFI